MPIGITEDHEALRLTVRRFLDEQCSRGVVRQAVDDSSSGPPTFWTRVVELGWIGLAVRETHGGSGYGCVELAVVLEEFGRVCAPGAFVTSAIAATVLDRALTGATPAQAAVLRVHLDEVLAGRPIVVANAEGVTLDHASATTVLVGTAEGWRVSPAGAAERGGIDVVRRPGEVRGLVPADLEALSVEGEWADAFVAVAYCAEAVGMAQWCIDTAAQYARDRVQFGKPIGQFQGVKHRCADMLARTELARAATWDALRALDDALDATDATDPTDPTDPSGHNGRSVAVGTAVALAIDGAVECAKDCIQTLGGIGFTWEHDAHLYLRRALALRAFVGGAHRWRLAVVDAAMHGQRRRLAVDLGADAEQHRDEVRAVIERVRTLAPDEQRRVLADEGYLTPAWPAPYGRDANALELLVIEEEFRSAKIVRPSIQVGAWALPNVIVYGTAEQQQRWIMPTLYGEISWCQLFSEPGAGSDLAALTTKAVRGDGGWVVNGQKVWTSMAKEADWGILLARTNPDSAKHDGISCFMLDMRTPGIDVRPLRELTGHAMFNEVFFDDVFVPDECLIGVEHDGWRYARTTLANERVFMGGNSTIGGGVAGALTLLAGSKLRDDSYYRDLVGSLVVQSHALAVLGFRLTLSALGGADPSGSEAAVRKLLGVQHDQRTQEIGMELCASRAVFGDGDAAAWSSAFLFNRCLTIAGGTTEIQKNVIGERLLGLPRD